MKNVHCTVNPKNIKQYNRKNLYMVFLVKIIAIVIDKYIKVHIFNLLRAKHKHINIIICSINLFTN